MKRRNLILCITLLFSINSALAECAWSAMQFFPQQSNISLNSMFIIEGYGESQKTVEAFKTRKVFLESDKGELIELTLIEILKGQKSLTQAVFKAVETLKPNTKYFLKYADVTAMELEEMYKWNSKTEKREKVFWQTSNLDFISKLNPNHILKFEKNEIEEFGCGPSVNAVFRIVNNNETEAWYKTEVVEIATKRKTTFYILAWKNKVHVGHDMCSGPFTYTRTGKYQVRFTPMNTDGEKLITTNWITFDSPYTTEKW